LNVRGGSCRPHRIQFAMSYTKVSAVEWVVGSPEHNRGVDERSERERFTGAKAQIECASEAALKGRSSTVRDRVGSAGQAALQVLCSRMRRFPPEGVRGVRPYARLSGWSLFCGTCNPLADTGLECRES
jgi:hypothetical protein